MNTIVLIILVVVVLKVIGVVVWRFSVRRRSLPCPPWLSFILDSPRMKAVAGPKVIFGRIGLARGMKVLDAGCGPGRLSIAAAKKVGGSGQVVAMDIQEAMLHKLDKKIAASRVKNVRPLLAGLGDGLLEKRTFDRALLVTVLGEVPDREAALREIYGALKPGGILSITEVFPDPHYQSPSKTQQLAEAAGFRLAGRFGRWYALTMNFERPAVGSGSSRKSSSSR